MKNIIIAAVIAAIVFGGAGFYGGMKYSSAKQTEDRQQRFGQMMGNSGNFTVRRIGNDQAGGFVNGEIISKDDKSLTVKLRDGGSKIVFFASSTQMMKSTEGSVADLQAGENVVVMGQANSDGSITAQSIQLRSAQPLP